MFEILPRTRLNDGDISATRHFVIARAKQAFDEFNTTDK